METIGKAFPGKQGGLKGTRLNVSRIYDQKFNIILEKLYNDVDCKKIDHDASLKDAMGYLGKTEAYREKFKLYPISEEEFLQVLHTNNRLREIMLKVREIDPTHNGYVTYQELDDIIKMEYPQQLNNRDIMHIVEKFESMQNKILIDYK
jgi:hypothetical protein